MKKYLIVALSIFLCTTQVMAASCPNDKPRIIVSASQGKVKYITNMARKDFIAKYPWTPNTTLGLTVAKLSVQMSGEPRIVTNARHSCVSLKEVSFQIGYDDILVYIHKDYKPGSCQYRVVKEHENYHVSVHRQAMRFFKSDIEKAIRKSVASLKPQVVSSSAEAQRVVNTQFAKIQKDIQPLIDHINKKIAEKNAAIDTPESYAASSKLCKSW